MNPNLVAVIKRITAEYGEAVLADPARLKVFFSDYGQNVPQDGRRIVSASGKTVKVWDAGE
jgi:hypothetical protein